MAALTAQRLFGVHGKTVLVTGGGRGIGEMIASGFVANGNKVYIASRDHEALGVTAERLNSLGEESGGSCVPITANLASREGCEELIGEIRQLEPRLDVLVNNSGASWGEGLDRSSGRMNWGWDKVLDVNLKAPFYLTRAALPLLDASAAARPGDPARVIMIGSVVGIQHQDVPSHAYDASKAAVHSLTRKLSSDLARRGGKGGRPQGHITVNAIAPGYVPSRMTAGLSSWGADAETMSEAVPLGRLGIDADMAGAALYLASPASSWVSGIVLPVDGGMLAQPLSLGISGEAL
uniref:Uncharacterized protein n=1 Tax=Rhizochromulina marina TaxID=1034831 RepID=A0A7S2WSB5_9STRA